MRYQYTAFNMFNLTVLRLPYPSEVLKMKLPDSSLWPRRPRVDSVCLCSAVFSHQARENKQMRVYQKFRALHCTLNPLAGSPHYPDITVITVFPCMSYYCTTNSPTYFIKFHVLTGTVFSLCVRCP